MGRVLAGQFPILIDYKIRCVPPLIQFLFVTLVKIFLNMYKFRNREKTGARAFGCG